MTITAAVRATVTQALRVQSRSKNELAAALSVTPSWVTKFFNGKLHAIDDIKAAAIEEFLGLKFQRLIPTNQLPAAAVQLGEAMLTNPALAEIMSGLVTLVAPQAIEELPFFETKELRQIGAEVTKIVHRWEEGEDPHYGRIGREVVELLSKLSLAKRKHAAKKAKGPKKS